jgi:putative ABC transport system permease protein
MNFMETFRVALTGLSTNRLRAILTTLGIIIGVGAVVSLVSLGRGVEDYVQRQFEDLGTDLLTITESTPINYSIGDTLNPLTMNEAEALDNPRIAPSIAQVAVQYNVEDSVVRYSGESTTLSAEGVTPNYSELNKWYPANGSFITQADVDSSARVAVLGTSLVETLFGDPTFDPIGETIFINNTSFEIVGVMEEQDSQGFSDPNRVIFIPISTAQSRLSNARAQDGSYKVDTITVQVPSEDLMDQATQEIRDYLMQAHDIQFQGDEDFTISSSAELLGSLTQITGILTIFLGAIAGISLLVGGIGIMNIMLVSVTERTREIGLRKAVGAQGLDILAQFLIESILLSIIGGIIGIVLGWLVTVIGSAVVPDLRLSITADAVILATGVSSFVGIFFGLYPASQAARMRPIQALRYE